MSASIVKLAKAVNINEWKANHNGQIEKYPKTSIDEYSAAVKCLINEIRKGLDAVSANTLKKIYHPAAYDVDSISMSREEFEEIIDEFVEGNFENLEKFKLFLITAAQLFHVFDVLASHHLFIRLYNELKKDPNNRPAQIKLRKLMYYTSCNEETYDMLDEVRAGKYIEIDKRIKKYTALKDDAVNFNDEIEENIPDILKN